MINMMIKQLLLIGIFLLIQQMSYASSVSILYQFNLPIASQSEEDRNQAMKSGLLEVFTKLTAQPHVGERPIIVQSLDKADRFVEEFSYSPNKSQTYPFLIHIKYHAEDIRNLLKKEHIPYWEEGRPLILVWLAYEKPGNTPVIIGNESQHLLLSLAKQTANHYGLPLMFPMMDMMEVDQMTPNIIKTMPIDVLKIASKRYLPQGLLIGKVTEAETVKSEWQLWMNDKHWNWQFTHSNLDEMMNALLTEVSQAVFKPMTTPVKITKKIAEKWVRLQIMHVSRPEDLEMITEALEKLSPVRQIEVIKISGDYLELSVLVRGDALSFKENNMDHHFILKSVDEDNQKWFYEWVR